jgi:hypothetical protein
MSRLLGVVFIYGAMFGAWAAAGMFMVLAPARFGNLIHDSLRLLPEVHPGDWGKRLAVRLAGVGLLVFAARFAIRIAAFVHQSG